MADDIEEGGEDASLDASTVLKERIHSPGNESLTSSVECDLMIESLQRELDLIRLELEAIVVQQRPPSGGDKKKRSTDAARLTRRREVEVKTLIRTKTKREPMPSHTVSSSTTPSNPPVKKEAQLSWEKQQYYINLVSERERERAKTRRDCLLLMEKHITNQLTVLQEKGDRLARKLQLRLAREKMSLPPRPVRTRSDISIIPTQPRVYKSSYYKAAANDYTTVNKKQEVHIKKVVRAPPVIRKTRPAVTVDYEDDDWTNSDHSNSWALTARAPIFKKVSAVKKAITPIPYPQFEPLEALLGKKDEEEEIQLRLHTTRMNKLENTHRQLLHMYELSRQHQRAVLFLEPDYEIEEENPSSSSSAVTATPTSRTLSVKPPEEKVPSLHSISSETLPPSQTLPIQQSLPAISPTPFLSLDDAVKDASAIKESKKLSSLWKNFTKFSETQKTIKSQ